MRLFLLCMVACPPGEAEPEGSDPHDSGPPADSGSPDSGDSAAPPENHAPTAPVVTIEPTAPAPGAAFSAVIVVAGEDIDGDEVSYRYAWSVDGADAGVDAATVSGVDTEDLQVWTVTVTPTDGALDGEAASASVTIGNGPPSAPVIHLDPAHPIEGDDITVVIDSPAVDPEGDPLTQSIAWYQDGASMDWLADTTVLEGKYVQDREVIRVVVSVTDGFHDPVTAEATVTAQYTCDNLPPSVGDVTTLSDARAYHGIAFDDSGSGYLIGWDGRSSLVRSEYTGAREIWVPGITDAEQIDRLPDGDWVYASSWDGGLMRVDSNGATSVITGSVNSAYGVTVGPDGMVYTAGYQGILRTDPDTGDTETLVRSRMSWTAHTVNFNLDSTVMYIGTIGSSSIWAVDLDANLDPVGSAYEYASGVGGGYHDGLEVDECGNLWVADYTTSGFYRVETDGTVTSMVRGGSTQYGHGAAFGRGYGGWRDDAIYQPQPYNSYTVREVVIGFGSGDTVRTWNGVAVPW
jgi:hypothetical protein